MIWSDHLIKPNQNRMPHSKLRNINRGNGNAVPCVRCARSPVLDHLAFIYLIFFSFGAAIRFLYYCLYAHTLAISGNLESYNVNHYLKCPRATHMHGGEKKKMPFLSREKIKWTRMEICVRSLLYRNKMIGLCNRGQRKSATAASQPAQQQRRHQQIK